MIVFRDIVAAAVAIDCLSSESICFLTHIRGSRNGKLAEPSAYDKLTGNYRRRQNPIPPEALIDGDFLTLDYFPHGGWLILQAYESLQEIETSILRGTGILNSFTRFVLPFVNGELQDFEVRDRSGLLIATHGKRVIDLINLDSVNKAKCRLNWMG